MYPKGTILILFFCFVKKITRVDFTQRGLLSEVGKLSSLSFLASGILGFDCHYLDKGSTPACHCFKVDCTRILHLSLSHSDSPCNLSVFLSAITSIPYNIITNLICCLCVTRGLLISIPAIFKLYSLQLVYQYNSLISRSYIQYHKIIESNACTIPFYSDSTVNYICETSLLSIGRITFYFY